jgi:hypothetical protein
MDVTQSSKEKLWTRPTIFLTIFMLVLFLVTTYFGFIFDLFWCVGLGLIYGISLAVSYYFDARREQAIRLMYVIQAAVVFVIILVFVYFQAIFGANPFGYDIFVLAFAALFAGGMFGIPVYRYAKIKPKQARESET